jgi:hypothetical protein
MVVEQDASRSSDVCVIVFFYSKCIIVCDMMWGSGYCRLLYKSKSPPRPVPPSSKPKRIYNKTQRYDRASRCHVVFLSRFSFFHPRESCFCCVSIELLDANAIFTIKFGYRKFFLYIILNNKIILYAYHRTFSRLRTTFWNTIRR